METSRSIFPESMIICRIAEGSYIALRKIKKGISLEPNDRQAIRSAMDFLKSAKKGEEAFRKLELGQEALSASYAFKEAFSAGAMTYNEPETKGVLLILDKILKILKKIEEKEIYDDESIDNLIKFFSHIRENTLKSNAGQFDKSVVWSNT